MSDWLVVEGIPRERNPEQHCHQSQNQQQPPAFVPVYIVSQHLSPHKTLDCRGEVRRMLTAEDLGTPRIQRKQRLASDRKTPSRMFDKS
jgi:hypothetical protein